MNYILLYLAVGLPVALGCGLAYSRADRVWKKCLFGLILLSVWPLIPVVMIREALALKRIQEVCAWCGETVVAFKNPNRIEIWKAHHKVCPKHPMREEIERLEKEIEQIRADHLTKDAALRLINDQAKGRLEAAYNQSSYLYRKNILVLAQRDRVRKDGDRLATFLDTTVKFIKDAGYGQVPEILDAIETYRRGVSTIDAQDAEDLYHE